MFRQYSALTLVFFLLLFLIAVVYYRGLTANIREVSAASQQLIRALTGQTETGFRAYPGG